MEMEIKFWNSSTVLSTEYDVEKEILRVEFKNGTIYEYYKFPKDKWDILTEAESIGKYLNTCVKGAYDYKKVKL